MKDGTTFNTQGNMALLLLGENGTGKSTLAMNWPSPWFCLGDKNIRYAAMQATAAKRQWFWDDPERDTADKDLPWEQRWARATALLEENGPKSEVKTIVDDGLTHLQAYLQALIIKAGSQAEKPLVIGGEAVMTRSMWGPFATMLAKRVIKARSFNKPYIMVAHLMADENELTKVMEQKVSLPGALKNTLGAYFTDVWQTDAQPSSDLKKYPGGVRYLIRTAPTFRLKLKCSMGLPPEVDVDGPEIKAMLAKLSGGVA
jgi:hypothetical protein